MLKSIDQALAGAIDVIADDVTATVKSVKEQGVMRTLGDAVEDAAGLVATGAKSTLSGLVGRKGPDKISSHSGISTGYADLCAPGGPGFNGGGGAAFPYVPNPSNGSGRTGWFSGSKSNASKPSNVGSFGAGVGICLPGQGAPGMPAAHGGTQFYPGGPPPPPNIAPYAGPGGGAASTAGAFRPPMPFSAGPSAAAAAAGQFHPSMPCPAPAPAAYNTPSHAAPLAPASSSTSSGKEPTLQADELARQVEAIVGREAANRKCFDCGSNDHEWASVSFGIFLCITCAGHHRRLGTHISRIRSCRMDSWTERQLHLFDSGGNQRLADFFRANNVPDSQMYQRYSTPQAEWYREAWVKNRTLGRPVPSPPQGVVVGPCVDDAKPAGSTSQAKSEAPPVDLLDFGGGAPATDAPTPQVDLLAFGGDPVTQPAQSTQGADLLGVGEPVSSHAGGLLGIGPGGRAPAGTADDLLGLASTSASTSTSAAAALSSLDFGTPLGLAAPAAGTAPAMGVATHVAFPAAGLASAAPGGHYSAPLPSERTLGGGAQLAESAKEQKADDPFAMALKQWAM